MLTSKELKPLPNILKNYNIQKIIKIFLNPLAFNFTHDNEECKGHKSGLTSAASKNNEDHMQTFSGHEYIVQNNFFQGISFDTSLNVKNMLVYFFLYGVNLLSLYLQNIFSFTYVIIILLML